MKDIEKKVIKVAVIEEMLKTVKPLLEDARAEIRTWLKSMNEPKAEIPEVVKAYLQISQEKTVEGPDWDATQAEFEALVKRGAFTQTELVELVKSGALVFTDQNDLLAEVKGKIKGYVQPVRSVTTPATDPNQAPLKILPASGARYDGLRNLVRSSGDLRAIVQRILEAPLESLPAKAPVPTPAKQAGVVAIGGQGARKK